jgi:hypothetical protein
LFLHYLDKAFAADELNFFSAYRHLHEPEAFRRHLAPAYNANFGWSTGSGRSQARTQSTIVEKVAEAIGLPKAEASRAVETLVQTIVDAAKAGDPQNLGDACFILDDQEAHRSLVQELRDHRERMKRPCLWIFRRLISPSNMLDPVALRALP